MLYFPHDAKEPGDGEDLREAGYLVWLVSTILGLNRFTSPRAAGADGRLICHDRHPESLRAPRVVVFDFDETLTIQTWVPEDQGFGSVIGYEPDRELANRIVDHSFGGKAGRLARLRQLLEELSRGGPGAAPPVLAVLTRSMGGAVAVLNVLRLAGLSRFFSAIWRINRLGAEAVHRADPAPGRQAWTRVAIPAERRFDSKAETIRRVAADPSEWFPHLQGRSTLHGLAEEEVVLVDDDPENVDGTKRYCLVPRFSQDGGNPLGGIGFRHSGDFKTLVEFIKFLQLKAEHPNMYKALHWLGR